MARKGSGALILIILLVMGAGYYLSQNPNALEQVQNNLDIQMPSGAGSGGGVCGEAMSWASSQGYNPKDCLCAESARNEAGVTVMEVILELEDGRYMSATRSDVPDSVMESAEDPELAQMVDSWTKGGIGSNRAEAQQACERMEQDFS